MNRISFLDLFARYINYHRVAKNFWEQKKPITLEIWVDKYNMVQEYLSSVGKIKLKAIDFDISLARAYFDWLLEKHSHNHAVRNIEICKSVLNFGGTEGYVSTNKINFLKIKRTPAKSPPNISPDQIDRIVEYFSLSIERKKAAHMMVVQIFTGYDYGDFEEIDRKNIRIYQGEKYIVKGRHKNGIECIAPVPDVLERILEMYDYKMKLMTNHRYNERLRDVLRECRIETGMHMTSRKIRKLFFMNKINNEGYPVDAASKMGGHKYIKTTQDYYVDININYIHQQVNKLKAI